MAQDIPVQQTTPSRTLGWAIYLGVSWTWCIGMYLPVLLLRDVGIGAFFAFAIPNVIGAAAMGWVLRDAGQSRDMVEQHESACVWFSLVTILFHAFFAAWIIRQMIGPAAGLWVGVAFWIVWLIFRAGRAGPILAAALTLAVSLAAFVRGFANGGLLPKIAHPVAGGATTGTPLDALWLAPVCVLGFGLCPYLDLTFHNARQAMPAAAARAAFAIGFAGVFALMIAFTFCYSGWLAEGFNSRLHPILILILGSHLIVQTCFTVAAHAEQLAPQVRKIPMRPFLVFAAAFVAVVLTGTISHKYQSFYRHLSLGELMYRCFMVFYGLIFPAYVWLRMGRRQASNLVLGFTILIAAPMYWMGFIERQMIWLVPAVLVVALARLAGKQIKPAMEQSEAPAYASSESTGGPASAAGNEGG